MGTHKQSRVLKIVAGRAALWASGLALVLLAGCAEANNPSGKVKASAFKPKETVSRTESIGKPQQPVKSPPREKPALPPAEERPAAENPRFLSDLLNGENDNDFVPPPVQQTPAPKIDENRARNAGIRKIPGEVVTIYTDLPESPAVDELPVVFAAAIGQWCEYFKIPPERTKDWKMVGYIIKDKERFKGAGMFDESLPPFLNGYQRGPEMWLYDQPSDYYRRHLLLHEGTHAFMNYFVGGCGPPWFSEGLAELLSTHRWQNGKLELNIMPANKEDVPYWGRVKIMRDDFAANRALMPLEIMQYPPRAHLKTEAYAWSWAAARFFDQHPRYRETFHAMRSRVNSSTNDFAAEMYKILEAQWPQVNAQWRMFVAEADYGYDVARAAIDFQPGEPLPSAGAAVKIAADRGWQSSRIELEAGKTYRIEAKGRYQIGQQPRIWWCEPNGVTIEYYQGLPLGMLVASIYSEEELGNPPFINPQPIGLGNEVTPNTSGTLYFRINEFCGNLDDNAGELEIQITPGVR